MSHDQQEQRIKALFRSPWIDPINFERKVAEVSRIITRRVGLAPKDSIHMATAVRHGVDFFVSTDGDFLDRQREIRDALEDEFPKRPLTKKIF